MGQQVADMKRGGGRGVRGVGVLRSVLMEGAAWSLKRWCELRHSKQSDQMQFVLRVIGCALNMPDALPAFPLFKHAGIIVHLLAIIALVSDLPSS